VLGKLGAVEQRLQAPEVEPQAEMLTADRKAAEDAHAPAAQEPVTEVFDLGAGGLFGAREQRYGNWDVGLNY